MGTNIVILLVTLILATVTTAKRLPFPVILDRVTVPVPDAVKWNASALDQYGDDSFDPETRPGLFQGDIAMDNNNYNLWRLGLRWDVFPKKRWKNGIVPYYISPMYEPSEQATILLAIRTLNSMTCVRFVPWNGESKDYLIIWPVKYPAGCWSFIGKTGGPQLLSLQPPDGRGPNCFGNEGRAIHELMHALGIFHEQSRWDRDKFVEVHAENIIPGMQGNFQKQSLENTTYSYEYDFNSIMHYGRFYFSKGPDKPTITAKVAGIQQLGQRRGLSKTDCLKINQLYGCLERPRMNKKYYNICTYMGI